MKTPGLTRFEATLWAVSAVRDPSLLPMVACFAVFLVNDLYGFVQWKRMQHRQED